MITIKHTMRKRLSYWMIFRDGKLIDTALTKKRAAALAEEYRRIA